MRLFCNRQFLPEMTGKMCKNMKNLEGELKKLPKSPGVYLMHDDAGEVIYIGKAKNLKNRVSQYFQASRARSPKIEKMVVHISYFEYTVTDSEVEALILENNLIKEQHPKYNTMLKDDKTYPYIKLTLSEDYPRLMSTRKLKRDKDKYYGPFPDATAVNEIIELLNRAYRLKTCGLKLPRDAGKERPCLNHHIGRCEAPCSGGYSKEEYSKKIEEIKKFLDGYDSGLIKELKAKMSEASERLEYEKAGEYKELLNSAMKISARQKMEYDMKENRDVLGIAHEGFDAIAQVFFIRDGKLIGRDNFYLSSAPDETDSEILASFIKQYYSGTPFLPGEILIPFETGEKEVIEDWLTQKAERKVQLIVPKRGQKEKIVELAMKNAKINLEQNKEKVKREEARTKGAATEISRMLGINYAKRIESYDISNTSGVNSVGSMVVFEDGKPKKNDYRKFKIKTVKGPNDVASMKEVLERRFSHEEKFPDLIMIDGGKGQVGAVLETLKKMNVDIPVCGMVKDDRHRTRGILYNGKEYEMDRSKDPFKLVTRIQDETHRFAIEYHRSLRSKEQTRSVLDSIEGIGPKRRLALIKHFSSIDAIREATEQELLKVPGMNIKAAENVMEFFAGQKNMPDGQVQGGIQNEASPK